VHIPVVLIPLVAIGVVAMSCSGHVRDRYGWLILGFGIVAGIATQLAVESGQALRRSVAQSAALRRHVHIASSLRPLILLLFLVGLGIMLVDRRARGAWPFPRNGVRSPVAGLARSGMIALAVVVATGTTVRLFQIGDSGAKATWQRVHLRAREARVRSGSG
jgi:hypothetical protein